MGFLPLAPSDPLWFASSCLSNYAGKALCLATCLRKHHLTQRWRVLCNSIPKGCPLTVRPLHPPAPLAAFHIWRGWLFITAISLYCIACAGEKCFWNTICALAPEPTCGFAVACASVMLLLGKWRGLTAQRTDMEPSVCSRESACPAWNRLRVNGSSCRDKLILVLDFDLHLLQSVPHPKPSTLEKSSCS